MKSLSWAVIVGSSSFVYLHAESGSAASEALSISVSAIPAATPAGDGSVSLHPDLAAKVLTLPRVVVEGVQLPSFSDREILTKEGMSLLLSKRYPGASFPGQDPDSSAFPNYAALMYSDDARLAQMNHFERVTAVTAIEGNDADAKAMKEEIQKTFIRKHDWRTEGMDKSVNRYRH